MGYVLSKIMSFFSKEKVKVIIIGLDNAGKTTVLYQLLQGETVETHPTIGSNVEEHEWNNVKLVMWDIGGQDSLRASWETYYIGTQFVIFVVDCSDRKRIPKLKEVFDEVLASQDLKNAQILVFANKQDIKDCMKPPEVTEKLGLTNIKDKTWHIQSCCALTGDGLVEGLSWIVSHRMK